MFNFLKACLLKSQTTKIIDLLSLLLVDRLQM